MLAVVSGKGGVGKSTISLNVAVALAQMGARVGLLDVDVYGPDIPAMIGLTRRVPTEAWTLSRKGGLGATPLEPIERHGVLIVSTGLLFGEEQALAWHSELVSVLLNQLIWSSKWGALDYLIIDMPPGTADVTQRTVTSLPTAGALVVVTPQEVAHLDARKLVSMLKSLRMTIIGGIENMADFSCSCCSNNIRLFAPVAADRSIWSLGVTPLGKIPFSPPQNGLAAGIPILISAPEDPQSTALRAATENIKASFEMH